VGKSKNNPANKGPSGFHQGRSGLVGKKTHRRRIQDPAEVCGREGICCIHDVLTSLMEKRRTVRINRRKFSFRKFSLFFGGLGAG
jgi:hypothetical protein